MGGSFTRTKMLDCGGQRITAQLNVVFGTPGSNPYRDAQGNNTFDKVPNGQKDNWKDLVIAYLKAGVDVGSEWPAWVAYLEALGAGDTGTQGPQNISLIAQTRYAALTADGGRGRGMDTTTGPSGRPVHATPGSPGHQATIESPCPVR